MLRLSILVAVVSLLAACGSTADEIAPAPEASTGLFLARAAGTAGPLTAHDGHELTRRFELPRGIAAADGSAYYALSAGRLLRFDPLTGRRTASFPRLGDWRLEAVSANGRWVALSRAATRLVVVDGRSGATAHELALDGDFLVETISSDGDFLFLQQTFADGRYAVRGYDLREGRLLAGSLATKGETLVMAGVATGTIASPDGRWLLTVYIDTAKDAAFVHALNLVDRLPICIDLPPCADCDVADLRGWGLTLSPDGRTLYAANPALGRLAEVDLPTTSVVHESRFRPAAGGADTRSAVAPDGSRVVFTNGETVWSYDTRRGSASVLGSSFGPVADLGVSVDGARVLLARPGQRALAVSL